jgi:serine protease inhibitor
MAETTTERGHDPFTGFGVRLFSEVAGAAPEANVIVSPAGTVLALAMALAGAGGETAEAMRRTLGVPGAAPDELDALAARVRSALVSRPHVSWAPEDAGVELSTASALWARAGVPLGDGFVRRAREHYAAHVEALDFDSPAAAERMNGWVREQTRGRIDAIVGPSILPNVVLYLMSAVYFKAGWESVFKEANTRDEPFRTASGELRLHPLMHQTASFGYREGDGFRAVRLGYAWSRTAMYVFLPDEGLGLSGLRARLAPERWEEWSGGFEERWIGLALPRFRVESDLALNEPLAALGMEVAFDEARADFTGMLAPGVARALGGLYISRAKQKTFVSVDEKGTEAAAATSVEMKTRGFALARPQPIPFVVDRPFLFAIRDDDTGTLLFLGQVADPA